MPSTAPVSRCDELLSPSAASLTHTPAAARRFTSQLPSLGLLGRTISHALPQVAAFFLISCVIFLAFAQCFFMAYFASVPGYQTFQASIMSVFRFTVLDFDYQALSEVRACRAASRVELAALVTPVRAAGTARPAQPQATAALSRPDRAPAHLRLGVADVPHACASLRGKRLRG